MPTDRRVASITISSLGTSECAAHLTVEVRTVIDGVEYVGSTTFVGKTESPYMRAVDLTAAR